LTRRTRNVLALMLLLLGAAALFLFASRSEPRGGGAAPRAGVDEDRGVAEPLDDVAPAVQADGAASARSEAAPPSREVPQAPAAAPFAVVGRCLVAGAPAGAAEVTLTAHEPRGGSATTFTERAGPDGRFRIEVPREPGTTLHLACGGPGLSRWSRHLGAMPDAPELDVGDVPLEPACTLTGSVTSQDGLPVADARVVFKRVFADPRDAASPPDDLVVIEGAAADEQGRFASRSLPAAVWDVEVTGLGILGTARERVDASGGGAHHVDLVVRVAAPIEGVVLVGGLPAPGVAVTCFGAESGAEASFFRKTDAEGRFRLETRPGWSSDEAVLVRLSAEELAHTAEPVPADWGEVGVVVLATPRPRALVRVVRATDGEPVTAYALRVSDTAAFGGRYVVVKDASGEVELEGVPREGAWVHVMPHDGRRARSPVSIRPGPEPLVIQVAERHAVDVDVVTADGEPVSDARVEVVALRVGTLPGDAPVVVAADAATLFSQSDAWRFATAKTDAEGRARLALPDLGGADLYLRLTGPAGEQMLERVSPDAAHARVALPVGATLVLAFSGDWPPGMAVQAERALEPGEPVPRDRIQAAQAPEPVELRGLAPGSWELRALYQGRWTTLGAVRIEGAERIERELDAGQLLVPARPVTVRRDDDAPAAGELVLEEERLAGFVEVFRAPLEPGSNASARVVLPLLPGGTYRARLAGGSASAVLGEAAWRADTWTLHATPDGG